MIDLVGYIDVPPYDFADSIRNYVASILLCLNSELQRAEPQRHQPERSGGLLQKPDID